MSRFLRLLSLTLGLILFACAMRSSATANSAQEVTVTVYFGGQPKATLEKSVPHSNRQTAMDALLSAARTETNAEKTFVKSIEGVANNDAQKEYWLYFVNGEPMHVGAAETKLKPGDRILWFLRRASSATHAKPQ
jgi:hypothetical protein